MNTKTLPITVQESDIEGIGTTTWWPKDNNENTAICLDPNEGNIYMQLIMLRNILQCFGEEYKVLSYEEIEHEDGDRCEYWIYTNLPKELYEEASKNNFFRNLPEHETGNCTPENIAQKFEPFVMTHEEDYKCENVVLKVPVEYVRWDYPVETEDTQKGLKHVHKLDKPVTTLHDLLREISKYLKQDYDNDLCTGCHVFEDYCTEFIDIHPNNSATVYFGS